MNIERLQHLITILQNVKPEAFDLSAWHCGTVACAVGHACLDPVFNRQGLKLWDAGSGLIPCYADNIRWGAVHEFFDLTYNQAQHLFSDSAYRGAATARYVIARIESLIKEPQ